MRAVCRIAAVVCTLFGPFCLDPVERVLRRAGEPLTLTPKAVETLLALVENHGHVLDRDELMKRVWPDVVVEENNLTQNVSVLRKILGDGPNGRPYIETVPRRGYRFIAEVREEWEEDESGAVGSLAALSRFRTSGWIWFAAAPTLIAGAGVWLYLAGPAAESSMPPMQVVPFTATPEPKGWPRFSPDGAQIAYVWEDATGTHDLATKLLGAETPLQLTSGAGDDHHPVWSPDGRFIAFIRQRGNLGLRTRDVLLVPALGGNERKLYTQSLPAPSGLDWSPDGRHLVFPDAAEVEQPFNLLMLSVETLQTRRLTSPPARSNGDSQPVFSPDGQAVAFVRHSSDGPDIYVVPVAGGAPRRVTHERRAIGGLAWTADGESLVFSSERTGSSSAAGGMVRRLATGVRPSWSRDGQWIYFQALHAGDWQVWKAPVRGGSILQVTTNGGHRPLESLDGSVLYYWKADKGGAGIWSMRAEGAHEALVLRLPQSTGYDAWAPADRGIYFVNYGAARGAAIEFADLETHQVRRVATLERGLVPGPSLAISPDGTWLLYTQSDYRRQDVMVAENFR